MKLNRAQRKDPLGGKREEINAGKIDSLTWPDRGQGSPVKVGEVFSLRTCHIEITRVHRVMAKGAWAWRAEFRRQFRDQRLYLLARGAGDGHGYATDPNHAIRAQDDPDAATLYRISDFDRGDEHRNAGEPPEPEAVPPHEVAELPTVQAAREHYAALKQDEIEKRLDRSMVGKLREVRIRARDGGVDVSEEMELIAEATERARRKVVDAGQVVRGVA